MVIEKQTLDEISLPSDRTFGFFFAFIFFCLASGCYFWWQSKVGSIIFALLTLLTTVLGFVAPSKLRWFNIHWMKFGLLIGKIINPLILLTLFFFVISPFAIVIKVFKRDELVLKKRRVDSYWKPRIERELKPDRFFNQF